MRFLEKRNHIFYVKNITAEFFRIARPSLTYSSIESLSINQSINQSIDQSINQSFNQSIIQSINHSIIQSFNQSINPSMDQLFNQSINRRSVWSSARITSGWTDWRIKFPLRDCLHLSRTPFFLGAPSEKSR